MQAKMKKNIPKLQIIIFVFQKKKNETVGIVPKRHGHITYSSSGNVSPLYVALYSFTYYIHMLFIKQ